MKEPIYTAAQLRAQVTLMHPRAHHPQGERTDAWMLNVGIGAGMLSVAADQIEALRNALQSLADAFAIAAAQGIAPAINNGALVDAVELLAARNRRKESE